MIDPDCRRYHGHPALPSAERRVLGERVRYLQATIPVRRDRLRSQEIAAAARTYGVDYRTALRYARDLPHTCVCHGCGRVMA